MTRQYLWLHIIDQPASRMLSKTFAHQVPAKGEEIRLGEEDYYKVVSVVHCYDEVGPYYRANIGVEKIK